MFFPHYLLIVKRMYFCTKSIIMKTETNVFDWFESGVSMLKKMEEAKLFVYFILIPFVASVVGYLIFVNL